MFDPDYFNPVWFDAPLVNLGAGFGAPLAPNCDSYFDRTYFDPTYFCTDSAPVADSGGRGGRVIVRRLPEPEPLEDPDELLALI